VVGDSGGASTATLHSRGARRRGAHRLLPANTHHAAPGRQENFWSSPATNLALRIVLFGRARDRDIEDTTCSGRTGLAAGARRRRGRSARPRMTASEIAPEARDLNYCGR